MSDTEELFDQIIPTAEFKYSPIGVTISSERLDTARFVPYDVPGKCRECPYKVDHVVSRDGIWTRCKQHLKKKKFVPFDVIYDLPAHCCFRLQIHGNVFNVPYKTSSWSESEHQKSPSDPQVEKQPRTDGNRKRKNKEKGERPTPAVDLDKMLNLVADAADYVHEVIAQKEEDKTPNESAGDQQNGTVDPSNSSNLTVPTF